MCEHARSMNEGESDAPVPVGFHYPVFSKLRELLTTLQREIKPPGEHDRDHIAYISTLLAQQTVQKEEWSQFVHFMENKYTRHLVAHDENFTVLLLCWNRNQRSPIHDHSGSSCWVRVLEGTITERRFATNGDGKGGLVEIGAADVGAGGVCYINDSQGLHEMANNQSDACTVTLHVYSPPYYYCNAFNMDGTKRQVSMLAAAAPPRQLVGMRVEPEELAQAAGPSAANPVSLVEFADLLDDTDAPLERITEAFDRVWLSQAEWATYAHFSDFRFQRLLIHQNDRYSLLMLCWLPGQETPPHTHNGASSWVRVLQGTLTFTEDPSGEKRVKLLSKQSDTFAEDSNLPMHTMGNKSTEYAVSLHLYNPPYTELHYGAKAACPCPVFPHCRGTVESHECLPVVQCQRLGKGSRSSSNNTTPLATGTQPQFGESMSMLTNLAGLVDRVEAIFANSKLVNERESLSVAIMETLESTPLSTADIEKYWQTKKLNGGRIRLFENTKFNITLNLWEPGHRSVAHDHDGSMSWIKVIEGALVDIAYETTANSDEPSTKIQVVRNSTMVQDDVVFYGPSSIHAMRNKSSVKRAATLHIYFGVCNSCRWFTLRYAAKPVKVSSQTTLSDEWHIFKSARSPSPEPSLVQTLKEVVSGPGARPANVSVPASPM